jgi:hypothetical protein
MVARKVVTRSGGHSRGLVPSIKNPIASGWESQWERGFDQLIELSPLVRQFVVQPEREPIVVEGVATTYIPDRKVEFIDGSDAYFEVKPAVKCRTARVATRLAAIRIRFQETGRRFYLITDEWLSQEPRRSNVALLMYHRRDFLLDAQERMRLSKIVATHRPQTVADLTSLVGKNKAWLLLGLSIVGVDLEQPLNDQSAIFLTGGHRHANFLA